jgi:hypothetical protein
MSGPMRQRVVAALRATGTVSITGLVLVLVLGTGPALADPAPGDSWGSLRAPTRDRTDTVHRYGAIRAATLPLR